MSTATPRTSFGKGSRSTSISAALLPEPGPGCNNVEAGLNRLAKHPAQSSLIHTTSTYNYVAQSEKSMSDTLSKLSELAGIHSGYYDIWGNRHETSEATQLALLQSIGILDGPEDDTGLALRKLEQAHWQEILPPVHVVRCGKPIELPCHLPVADLEASYTLLIRLEDGHTLTEAFSPINRPHAAAPGKEIPLVAVTLQLAAIEKTGYHTLELSLGDEIVASSTLIVCPDTAYLPESFDEGGRHWGLAIQLYSLRSGHNWGLGDYSDLSRAIDWAAHAGASLVGINPLHALFPSSPGHCSPYSPSSRQYLNVLHIDVAAVPEYSECASARSHISKKAFRTHLTALRKAELIDYPGVAKAKFEVLALLYRHFREKHLTRNTSRGRAFKAFLKKGGEELRLFALYHALQDHFVAKNASLWGWPVWPEPYQHHESPQVAAFAKRHKAEVEWHAWLQWLAETQLAQSAEKASRDGMAIGLYQDLAVGVDKAGAEVWMHHDMYALDCRIGCPPDDFNLLGQDWGLPPWIPHKLRAAAYAPYIAMLRANMKYSGALRIDHVMGLMRLYWIPAGMKGDAGAYLSYPLEDLLGILALESQRNHCVIVGEDLGTVPPEVRHVLGEMGVLTYRLFYFERQKDGHFMPPAWYPRQALVSATTHDLPTLTGYWQGRDNEARTELQLFPSEEVRQNQIEGRRVDRIRLLEDLAHQNLLPEGMTTNPDDVPELTPELLRAILAYVASTPSFLALVQAEDMLGQVDQANMPGTVDENPNWRRKLTLAVEQWKKDDRCQSIGALLTETRRPPV